MKVENRKSNVYIWVECIKIFAAFLIVMQHSISAEWVAVVGNNSYESGILNFVFMITRAGVPLFFMCSGIGMLSRERELKTIFFRNITGIVIPYILWMLVYGLYEVWRLFDQNLATARTVLNALAKNIIFGQYHTWFILTLIGLYLITPFLYLIVRKTENTVYFLILSIVFTIVIPYISEISVLQRANGIINNFNMHFVVGYSLYFVVGYYLSRIELTSKVRLYTIISLIVSIVAGWCISCWMAQTQGELCQSVYGDFSIIGFVRNVSLLLLFRILFETISLSEIQKHVIKRISTVGIGIYLLHPIFLNFVQRMHGMSVILGGILLWIAMLVLMLILSMCPVINRLFLRIRK